MLSQKEILQTQAQLRMAELRAIGANINHFKECKYEQAVKHEELEYQKVEDKLQLTLSKIRELYGE